MASSAAEITNHQGKLLVTCWMLNSCKINFYLSYPNKKDKSALEHSPFLCISSSTSPSQSLYSGICQNSNFSPCKIVNRLGLVIGKPTEVSNEKKKLLEDYLQAPKKSCLYSYKLKCLKYVECSGEKVVKEVSVFHTWWEVLHAN